MGKTVERLRRKTTGPVKWQPAAEITKQKYVLRERLQCVFFMLYFTDLQRFKAICPFRYGAE